MNNDPIILGVGDISVAQMIRQGSCMVKNSDQKEFEVDPQAAQKAKLYLAARSIGVTPQRLLEMRGYAAELKRIFHR